MRTIIRLLQAYVVLVGMTLMLAPALCATYRVGKCVERCYREFMSCKDNCDGVTCAAYRGQCHKHCRNMMDVCVDMCHELLKPK